MPGLLQEVIADFMEVISFLEIEIQIFIYLSIRGIFTYTWVILPQTLNLLRPMIVIEIRDLGALNSSCQRMCILMRFVCPDTQKGGCLI